MEPDADGWDVSPMVAHEKHLDAYLFKWRYKGTKSFLCIKGKWHWEISEYTT